MKLADLKKRMAITVKKLEDSSTNISQDSVLAVLYIMICSTEAGQLGLHPVIRTADKDAKRCLTSVADD